jgi:hypothetical protein
LPSAPQNKSCQRIVYGEKDTAYKKILQRIAYISADVTYSARNLSNAAGNWHEYVQMCANALFWLFFSNLLPGLVQSIFVTPL